MARTIWIVEDSDIIREELSWELTRFGFIVTSFAFGEEALAALEHTCPALILVDATLTDMPVGDFCAHARELSHSTAPLLVAIAPDGDTAGKLLSSHLSVEDCIVKPFTPHALVKRIHGIMAGLKPKSMSSRLTAVRNKARARLAWSPDSRRIEINGGEVQLAPIEHKLLGMLLSKKGEPFSRADLLSAIWNNDAEVSQRSVDVAMVSLRRKLGAAGNAIQTVRGIGYRYME